MSIHNLCFRAKIRGENGYPVHPSFTIQKWGVRGYSLHGLVFVMIRGNDTTPLRQLTDISDTFIERQLT